MTICDRGDAGDLPVDILVAAREGSGQYGRIVNDRQNVLTERTSRRSLYFDRIRPCQQPRERYHPRSNSMDLASLIHCSVSQRFRGLGNLTGAAPSVHASYFSLKFDFDEVPAQRFRPRGGGRR